MAKKEKSLRRMGRRELLEQMLKQSEENEALKAEIVRLNGLLSTAQSSRTLFSSPEVPGTLAEAAVKLSGLMEAADEAARIFLSEVERSAEERQEQEFELQRRAREHAERIINEAHEEARRTRQSADDYCYRLLRAAERGEQTGAANATGFAASPAPSPYPSPYPNAAPAPNPYPYEAPAPSPYPYEAPAPVFSTEPTEAKQ